MKAVGLPRVIQDDLGDRRVVGNTCGKSHQRSTSAADGLFGFDQGGHVIAHMAALVGEETDHDDRVGAQCPQRVGDERRFLQAGGLDQRERSGLGEARGMPMQRKRTPGGSSRSVADDDDGGFVRRKAGRAAR